MALRRRPTFDLGWDHQPQTIEETQSLLKLPAGVCPCCLGILASLPLVDVRDWCDDCRLSCALAEHPTHDNGCCGAYFGG
jgi:hypothetical protein